MIDLPPAFSARGAGLNDIEAIWRLMVEVELAEFGTQRFGLVELETWLTNASFDLSEDVLTVRDEMDRVVAVEIVDSRAPYVRPFLIGGVHPDHVGRGIGSALLDWALRRANQGLMKAPGDAKVTMVSYTAAHHEPSAALMEAAGFRFARYFMDMEIEFADPPPQPVIPPGVTIRPFDPDSETESLVAALRDGFIDHYGFVDAPVEERMARLRHWMASPLHDPTLWWIAEADGEIVGFNLCEGSSKGDESIGYVASLAVMRPHRGRGLGRALLLVALNEFFHRGKKGAELGVDVDSLTGATRLYESVGMTPATLEASWERELRAGRELATVSIN